MEYAVLVIIHVLLAIIIIGGILIGRTAIIPFAGKSGNADFAFNFDKAFSRGSHAALTIQFLVGFRLAMLQLSMGDWFTFESSMSVSIVAKLALWVLLFAWTIIGKKMKLNAPETADLSGLKKYYNVLTIFALALLFFGLNMRLALV